MHALIEKEEKGKGHNYVKTREGGWGTWWYVGE